MRLGGLVGGLVGGLAMIFAMAAPLIQTCRGVDTEAEKAKAFFVGTNYYEENKRLNGCANDVEAFRNVLSSWDVDLQAVVLTSREGDAPEARAGKAEIEAGFDAFLAGLTSEDVAIVALSGHGCQIADASGRLRTYYAPRDARFADNGKTLVVESLVDLSSMIDRLARSDAKFKWMIVDACRDTKNEEEGLRDMSVESRELDSFQVSVAETTEGIPENLFLLQSCAAGQTSAEGCYNGSNVERGAYMLSLCEALTDEGNAEIDGNARVVPLDGACGKAKEIVRKYNPAQTPTNTLLQNSSIVKFPIKSVLTAKAGDVAVDFVWIPQGEFAMGSSKREPIPGSVRNEAPTINVKITRGYWLARTETTNELWAQVMGETLEEGVDSKKPVVGKTRVEVDAFVAKLNESEAFLRQFAPWESDVVFEASLPTEAQWERACRAGEEGEVVKEIPAGIREVGTTPEDENRWGLLDMFGNAREWQRDWYEDYADATSRDLIDREGTRDLGVRVVRGAPASSASRLARATQREGVNPNARRPDVGFRLVIVRKRR